MTQISILGCGWLGLPLAESLIKSGYKIKGSTTSTDKLELLRLSEIKPFLIKLSAEKIMGDVDGFLNGSEILIINVPPGMRRDISEKFSKKMELLIAHLSKAQIKKLLFVSSTSVFGNHQGEVDETTIPVPDTPSGEDLLLTENLLKNSALFKTTIIRFGGLIGDDRHPVNYLSGRANIVDGNAPINLIHQKDCVRLINLIIEKEFWGKTIHGVFPFHPPKKQYYSEKARDFQLPLPHFVKENTSSNFKVVNSCVMGQKLPFKFIFTIE